MYVKSICSVLALISATPALAQSAAGTTDQDNSLALGQIVVTGTRPTSGVEIEATTINADALRAFDRTTLDDALNLLPGVNGANSGGTRNERTIYVRGFNRFEVPLTIDGIRVFLPADNRLDFGRFVTEDVAEVQVAKGYVSVLNGPDGMGGAINLVTRKPTKEIEAEASATLNLGREGEYAGYNAFGLLGTRHDKWYAQASIARNYTDHWDLAGGFVPTANENGGHRNLSTNEDWRANAKIGFTPNATDEYVLSYTRQEGAKLAPFSVTDPIAAQKYWTWPAWNLDSLYFLSTTALGDTATLKTRVYRNTFYNMLSSFSTVAENTQTTPKAFNSPYTDEAIGGSAQLDLRPFQGERLSLSAQYRRDKHLEQQQSYPGGTWEPLQEDLEETYSLGLENELTLAPAVTLTLGGGYDWRNLSEAQDYGAPVGTNPATTPSTLFSYPLRDSSAWSGQGALRWTPTADTELHASISSRARFPTIFERFSQRFGTSIPNPDLKPERATNYEIGGSRVFGTLRAEAAVFYSQVSDAIVNYPTLAYSCTGSTAPPVTPVAGCTATALTQSRNLGHGDFYGAELTLTYNVAPTLSLGANYGWTHRDLHDPSNPAYRPVDVPEHKAFLYADWAPVTRAHVLPSLELASSRWTVTDVAPIVYYRTGSYANAGLRLSYDVLKNVEVSVGARNLFDDNYQLVDGYPEAGRSFYLSFRAKL